MKNSLDIVPITKVFSIIDSCINAEQIEGCAKLAVAYTNLAKSKGVINSDLIAETLHIKLQEKIEELERVETFCIN
jgi:hypothetical protein